MIVHSLLDECAKEWEIVVMMFTSDLMMWKLNTVFVNFNSDLSNVPKPLRKNYNLRVVCWKVCCICVFVIDEYVSSNVSTTSNPFPWECGQCWVVLVSLCLVCVLLSALISSACVYCLCRKTDKGIWSSKGTFTHSQTHKVLTHLHFPCRLAHTHTHTHTLTETAIEKLN